MSDQRLEIRPASEGDHTAILRLLEARDLAHAGLVQTDLEDVKWRWREKGFDPSTQTWLVLRKAEVIAYALTHEGEIEVHVHPDHLGGGLGTRLRELTEERALLGAPGAEITVRQNPSSKDPAARPLLEAAGYRLDRFYARMERSLEKVPPSPTLPARIKIRSYVLGRDDHMTFEAHNTAWQQYSDQGWEPKSFESWMNQTKGEDFDPAFWLLAIEEGEIAGFSLCFKYPDMIWLQALGTLPTKRHRGIGRTLLTETLLRARTGGYSTIGLTVSSRNLADARRLYESVGFEETLRYENMRKILTK